MTISVYKLIKCAILPAWNLRNINKPVPAAEIANGTTVSAPVEGSVLSEVAATVLALAVVCAIAVETADDALEAADDALDEPEVEELAPPT